MRCFLTLSVLFLTIVAQAQDVDSRSASTTDMNTLRQELAAQRELILQQEHEIRELKARMNRVLADVPADTTMPATAYELRTSTDVAGFEAPPTILNPQVPAHTVAFSQQEIAGEDKPSPLYFHIGGMGLTPGGFLDFTSIFRSTNVGSGLGTSFGAIPLANTNSGELTESRFSAQNSRLSLKVTGTAGGNDITGYVETDFGGFLPTNAFVTSNSDTLRLRLFWIDLKRSK